MKPFSDLPALSLIALVSRFDFTDTPDTTPDNPWIHNCNNNGGAPRFPKLNSFEDMGIRSSVLRGMFDYGFEKPSLVQKLALFPLMHEQQVIVRARAGTGKTVVLGCALLHLADQSDQNIQCLVLVPTRELAIGESHLFQNIGTYCGVRVGCLFGGAPLSDQKEAINNGKPQILVATPGRLLDFIQNGWINLQNLKHLILDEADALFSHGFEPQLRAIIGRIKEDVRRGGAGETMKSKWFPFKFSIFSSTFPQDLMSLVQNHPNHAFDDHMYIDANPPQLLLGGDQFYVNCEKDEWKLDALVDLIGEITCSTIVFCNTRKRLDWLVEHLKSKGLNAAGLSSVVNQNDQILKVRESI